MARPEYSESPRSSRSTRKNPRNVLPPAPEVDWSKPVDEGPASPPRRSRRERTRDRSRHTDADWDQEEEELPPPPRTPDSRTSSSSYHPSHDLDRRSGYRQEQSTSSSSTATSRTSVVTPQPTRSSMTRQPIYTRPSVSIRGTSSAGYEDGISRASRRSQSHARSAHMVSSLSRSRNPSLSEFESQYEDTEMTDDNREDGRGARSHWENTMVHVSRGDPSPSRSRSRSRSRPDRRRSGYRQRRRHEETVIPVQEDYDETESRHPPSHHEEPPSPRTPTRTRSLSRAASVRQILHHQEDDHVYDRENDMDNDADSEDPPSRHDRDLRERFERPITSHKHGHNGIRDHRRTQSERHAKRSPPSKRYVSSAKILGIDPGSSRRVRSSPKRYYESEILEVEKHDRHHPPSTSLRRSNTVNGSMPTSQHQSVSSSRKRSSSSTFLGNFFGSSLHGHHHQAPDKPVKLVDCVICMDSVPSRKAARLKCSHRMCHSCLKRSFKLSITDPQHMPPKCCTADNIPLKHVERLFDNDFKKTWNKKFTEFSARNRIYCPKRGCGEFIRPEDTRHTDDGRNYGKCGKCKTKVCVQCNGKYHRGRDCPKDEETMKLLAQAKDKGWQRCFRCKAMVELKEGCNHMTCRCGAQFCMICGVRWKSCECPWFNYETVENDRLQHMQVPMAVRDRFGGHPAVDVPPSPPREGRHGAGPGFRPGPQSYEEEMHIRQAQEERDEALARRLQSYPDFNEEREDDFIGGFGDMNAIGNAAGHFMNEDFRPRPRVVSQQPPPHAPTIPTDPPAFDRVQSGDYIQGVNRLRGVRASSMTRLAERFNPDLRQGSNRRSPMTHAPPTLQTSQTMPLPVMTPALGPALAPGPVVMPTRRRKAEGDVYMEEMRPRSSGTRSVERVTASGRTTRPVVYTEPEEIAVPNATVTSKKHRDSPRAKRSAMAGLTEGLKGRFRVDEWRAHVAPGEPAK